MDISSYELGKAKVVALAGELRPLEVRRVVETFLEVLRAENPVIVVDLRGLDYLSSAGLAILFRIYKRALQREKKISFVRGRAKIQEVLEMSGLSRLFDLYDTPAEAAKSEDI